MKHGVTWPRYFLEMALADALEAIPEASTRCLNLGCGTRGRYQQLLERFEVDGVDIADPGRQPMPWRYHRCDASALPFADQQFNVSVAIESFEHIEENVLAMGELHRTLKEGGRAIITTPTHWTWIFELGRHGPHYYSKRKLIELAEGAGIKVHRVDRLGGPVMYLANCTKSWLSPIGRRIFGSHWFGLIDRALLPAYMLAALVDPHVPVLPSNWILIGERPVTK